MQTEHPVHPAEQKKPQTRRPWVFGLAVVVLLAALVYGFVSSQEPAAKETPKEPVFNSEIEFTPAQRAELTQQIKLTQAAIDAQKASGQKQDLDLYIVLADAQQFIGDLEAARKTYEEFLELNSLHYASWNSYGNLLKKQGEYERALAAYKEAYTLEPLEEFYRDYVTLLQEQFPDRQEEVRDVLEEAISELGQRRWLNYTLAQWHMDYGDCEEGLAHYKVVQGLLEEKNDQLEKEIADARARCFGME